MTSLKAIFIAGCVVASTTAAQSPLFRPTDDLVPEARVIQPADVDGDGDLDLVVHGATSLMNEGDGRFVKSAAPGWPCTQPPIQPWDFGSNFWAIADFNADGFADVLRGGSTGFMHLHLGNGAGGFASVASSNCPPPGTSVNIGPNFPKRVSVGDVDGDGDVDALVACGAFSPVAPVLLLNNGVGSFTIAPAAAWGLSAIAPASAQLHDVDGDGDLDIVGLTGVSANPVFVCERQATGFGAPVFPALPGFQAWNASGLSGYEPLILVGDLDGDGLREILLRGGPGASATLLTQSAPFVFTILATLPNEAVQPNMPIAADIADLDGDFVDELVVASRDGIVVRRVVGGALVSIGPVYAKFATGVKAFDADGDGDLDLLINEIQQGASIVPRLGFRNASGVYVFPPRVAEPTPWPARIDVVDFDGDGDLDIAGVHATTPDGSSSAPFVSVNRGDGAFETPASFLCVNAPPFGFEANTGTVPGYFSAAGPSDGVLAADLDADGDLDFVGLNLGSGAASDYLFRNDGGAGFVAVPLAPPPPGFAAARPLLVVDLANDGFPDVVCRALPTGFIVRMNVGGVFGPPQLIASTLAFFDLDVVDFDLDGDPDLALAVYGWPPIPPFGPSPPGGAHLFRNDAPLGGGLVPHSLIASNFTRRLIVGDYTGDGVADIVADNGLLFPATGPSTFGGPIGVLPGAPSEWMIFDLSFDYEGDGDLDLVALSGLNLLLNVGAGSFAPAGPISAGGFPILRAGDFDRDGDADILGFGPSLFVNPTRGLSVVRPAAPGRVFGVRIYGPSNGGFVLGLQPAPSPFVATMTPWGSFVLDASLAAVLSQGPLSFDGVASDQWLLPDPIFRPLLDETCVLQAAVVGPSGIRLTNPRLATVLDL